MGLGSRTYESSNAEEADIRHHGSDQNNTVYVSGDMLIGPNMPLACLPVCLFITHTYLHVVHASIHPLSSDGSHHQHDHTCIHARPQTNAEYL